MDRKDEFLDKAWFRGGQKEHNHRVVLPVADNILRLPPGLDTSFFGGLIKILKKKGVIL